MLNGKHFSDSVFAHAVRRRGKEEPKKQEKNKKKSIFHMFLR
jgi:hypothetical protein